MEVDMGVRVKPFRQYFVEGTYRMPTHYVEVFADPTDKKAYDLYRGLATSIVTLQHKTKKKNRYELVTFVSQAGEATFKASQQENELAKMYKIGEMPRMMVNRNLMTPYGTLNNHTQLEDLSTYSPAMKISSKVTDVYEYLLQRGFYGPAFAQMTPSVTRNSDGKFVCRITGQVSEQQETKGLRMNVYLVENNFIPETDDDGYVEIPDGTVYNKFVKMISPVEGYELKVNNDRTYTFATEPFAIENFKADKYRLVASIIDPCTEQPYLASVLQSCGINVTNEQPAEVSMTTAQASGEISFALAAKETNTPITIDWGDGVRQATGGHGADVILDIMGAKYLEANVKALAKRGRMVVIGLQGGTKGTLNLGLLLQKMGTIAATSLRFRPAGEKAEICTQVAEKVWPKIASGEIRPAPETRVPFDEVRRAHKILESGDNVGKLVLEF